MNLRTCLGYLGATAAVLLLQLGCIDPLSGTSVNGTALYAFNSASAAVEVWDDTTALYSNVGSSGDVSPTRRITGSVITNNLKTPAIAGVCFDTSAKRLFLVDASGAVVRIERADKQNGEITSSSDIAAFTLDSSQRLQGSSFGQAAVDPQNGTLYVTENGTSQTRIWVVATPGNYGGQFQLSTATLQALQTTSSDAGGPDTGGTGVAVSQNTVYGYFSGGSSVPSPTGTSYTGARLRSGSNSSFSSKVIVGSSTTLEDSGSGGCLALDTGNNFLYVFRSNSNAGSSGPIAVFTTGAFTSSYNQAPTRFLGTATGQPSLRIIAHGGNKDWLGGAKYTSATKLFSNQIWIWKNPSQGGDPVTLDLTSTAAISGLAFDGSN